MNAVTETRIALITALRTAIADSTSVSADVMDWYEVPMGKAATIVVKEGRASIERETFSAVGRVQFGESWDTKIEYNPGNARSMEEADAILMNMLDLTLSVLAANPKLGVSDLVWCRASGWETVNDGGTLIGNLTVVCKYRIDRRT